MLPLKSPGNLREQRGRLVFLPVHLASLNLSSVEITVVCSQKCLEFQAAHLGLIRIPIPV